MARPTGNGPYLAVAAILAGAGVAHFVRPEFFDEIVPDWMPGSKRVVTQVSGAVELVAAALTLSPRTRRLGGWVALATFAGVYPANVQAALDGGMKGMDPPYDSAPVAWARLPLQLPLLWAAFRVARPGPDAAA